MTTVRVAYLLEQCWHPVPGGTAVAAVGLAGALAAGDAAEARETFLQERQACIVCHVAEGFDFINQTPMFEETTAFPAN